MATEGVIRLRRAREDDARAIAEVHVATWRHAYRDLLPADFLDRLSVENRERWWRAELDVLPEKRMPWIAVAPEETIGFVSVGPTRDAGEPATVGEVYTIYVAPRWWDRGIGRNLLQHAQRDLLEHGYTEAMLWVLAGNERARRFYEAAGWRENGERTEDVGGLASPEVRYRRRLV